MKHDQPPAPHPNRTAALPALLLALLALLLLSACQDIREDKYPSGKVRLSTPYVENKKQGVEQEFYESGKRKAERHFLAGKEVDTTREYFENGQLQSEIPYQTGAIEGTVIRYYANGQTKSRTLYAKGLIAAFPEEFDSLGAPLPKGSYTDPRDGYAYDWVRIGKQVWTAQNLNFGTEQGSVCAQCNVWGRLYDFESIQKACPAGFHIPSVAEWKTLLAQAGPKPATALKATFGWNPLGETGNYGNGTDSLGFSVRAAGGHFAAASVPMDKRIFKDAGEKAWLWTAEGKAVVFRKDKPDVTFEAFPKEFGASLRCVLDAR